MLKQYIAGAIVVVMMSMLCSCGSDKQNSDVAKPLHFMSVEDMFPGMPLEQMLAKAAASGSITRIDELIDKGANVNAQGAYGVTVPAWVLYHPNIKGFKHLLERGADPNIPWEKSGSLMTWSVLLAPEIGVEFLRAAIEVGNGNPNLLHPEDDRRPLNYAAARDDIESFRVLYNAGAEIDFFSPFNEPFVNCLLDRNNFEVALFVLHQGVDFKRKGPNGRSMVKFVVEHKANKMSMYFDDEESRWFWRCVDYMERNGMHFDISADIKRPSVLDTTPPGIFKTNLRKLLLMKTSYIHEIKLTYPTPAWTHSLETQDDFQMRNIEQPGSTRMEYVPKNETFEHWKHAMIISSVYTEGTFESFVSEVLQECGRIINAEIKFELLKETADSQLIHLQAHGTVGMEGYVYIGRFNKTFFQISQLWNPAALDNPEKYRSNVVNGLKKIKADKGFAVAPIKSLN